MNGNLHDSKPNGSTTNTLQYITKWIESLVALLEERDRRYEERFRSQEVAVSAAFQAQKELNRVMSDASEKAIIKAENAQRDYNQRSNEFRGALDDQAKAMSRDMISRNEFESARNALGERIDAAHKKYDDKIEDLKKDIGILREAQSAMVGRSVEKVENRSQNNWTAGIVIATAISILSLVITIARSF